MDIAFKLQELIDVRVEEIAMIKKSIHSQNNNESEILMKKYSIVMFYSLWEGFFCDSIGVYIKYINSLNVSIFDFHECLFAYCMSNTMELEKNITDFDKHIKLSKDLLKIIGDGFIQIPEKVNVKSNTSIDVMNKLLKRLRIPIINKKRESGFNLLLKKRNYIAHGDSEGSYVNDEIISRLSNLVTESMNELSENILDAIEGILYLKDQIKEPIT